MQDNNLEVQNFYDLDLIVNATPYLNYYLVMNTYNDFAVCVINVHVDRVPLVKHSYHKITEMIYF